MKTVKIQEITIGNSTPFVLIAGPCVIEDESSTLSIAERLKVITDELSIPLIFKAS
ncbi:MAG: 3-deoxy-8-phosphooctulonate synthase, partial [Thermodesulfobacteriota bacterium]